MTNDRTKYAGEPAGAQAPDAAVPPPRILVVDDDRDLRQLYTEALAGSDFHVDVAGNGAAGWAALQAGNYHLLISEHDLPDLSGIELVGKLRAARMSLPVVMAVARLPTDELTQNPSLRMRPR